MSLDLILCLSGVLGVEFSSGNEDVDGKEGNSIVFVPLGVPVPDPRIAGMEREVAVAGAGATKFFPTPNCLGVILINVHKILSLAAQIVTVKQISNK